ncbi:MAG: hypothetical protein MI757_13930 [Pirellulales bacterium]|nr:hypothetical protein [Pirellulales bacterium]
MSDTQLQEPSREHQNGDGQRKHRHHHHGHHHHDCHHKRHRKRWFDFTNEQRDIVLMFGGGIVGALVLLYFIFM